MNRTGEDSRDTTPEPPEKGGVLSQSGRMKPFPVEALPKVVRAYAVESADAIGVDASMVAAPILATLGAAIGTTRAALLKAGYIEYGRIEDVEWKDGRYRTLIYTYLTSQRFYDLHRK